MTRIRKYFEYSIKIEILTKISGKGKVLSTKILSEDVVLITLLSVCNIG